MSAIPALKKSLPSWRKIRRQESGNRQTHLQIAQLRAFRPGNRGVEFDVPLPLVIPDRTGDNRNSESADKLPSARTHLLESYARQSFRKDERGTRCGYPPPGAQLVDRDVGIAERNAQHIVLPPLEHPHHNRAYPPSDEETLVLLRVGALTDDHCQVIDNIGSPPLQGCEHSGSNKGRPGTVEVIDDKNERALFRNQFFAACIHFSKKSLEHTRQESEAPTADCGGQKTDDERRLLEETSAYVGGYGRGACRMARRRCRSRIDRCAGIQLAGNGG